MGIACVGVLIQEGSNNKFVGKVLSDGAGHVGGYGYLRVVGDNNAFTVVRDGLGASIPGGIGTLIAIGDHNTYTWYMPAPKDPSAPKGTYGSGGVVSDLNNCDAGTGIMLGSGSVGGLGVFRAYSTLGNSYNAPIDSLGSGTVFGTGRFTTTGGGDDTYTGPGATGRAKGSRLY